MLPDVVINILTGVASATTPTDTSLTFNAGITQRGPSGVPRFCASAADFASNFGVRLANSTLYDWTETFLAEGGSGVWHSRALGAGALPAKYELKKGGEVSLVVKAGSLGAEDPGTWGNALEVAVVAVTGGYRLRVYLAKALVEESTTCATQADAVAWATRFSRYVKVSIGAAAGAPDAVEAKVLSAGADGAEPGDEDFARAYAAMPPEMGPGQVACAGQTTESRQAVAAAHALATNRFFVPDFPDTPTAATLIAAAQALAGLTSAGTDPARRRVQPVAPWDVIPGLGVGLNSRVVPPSARLCAEYSRVDALGNPNRAAAGPRRGLAKYVIDLSQPAWSDADRQSLNEAGVTVSRRRYGNRIATWGFRTLADPVADALWSMAPGVRTIMAFRAEAAQVGEQLEFEQIDDEALSELKREATSLALRYFGKGALKDRNGDKGFSVNTGEAVNPPAQQAEGKMRARVGLRVTPGAEQVIFDIVRAPLTADLI